VALKNGCLVYEKEWARSVRGSGVDGKKKSNQIRQSKEEAKVKNLDDSWQGKSAQ
jgi:hypothetical protein